MTEEVRVWIKDRKTILTRTTKTQTKAKLALSVKNSSSSSSMGSSNTEITNLAMDTIWIATQTLAMAADWMILSKIRITITITEWGIIIIITISSWIRTLAVVTK